MQKTRKNIQILLTINLSEKITSFSLKNFRRTKISHSIH